MSEENLVMEKKIYKVGGKDFYCPEQVGYLQWTKLKNLFKGINLKDVSNIANNEAEFSIGTFLNKLIESDRLPEFFAILLIPSEKVFWEESNLSNKSLMMHIGDKDAVEITTNFLLGRGELMGTLIGFLNNLNKDGKLSFLKSVVQEKEDNQK